MSGIVDMWTSELAKLKNKGQAIFSSGSVRPSQEAAPVEAQADEKSGAAAGLWWPTGLVQALQVKKLPGLQCSEASLSMLLDNFSA